MPNKGVSILQMNKDVFCPPAITDDLGAAADAWQILRHFDSQIRLPYAKVQDSAIANGFFDSVFYRFHFR